LWLHSLKVAQLLRSAACLHTNQSRSYLNHLVIYDLLRPSPTPKKNLLTCITLFYAFMYIFLSEKGSVGFTRLSKRVRVTENFKNPCTRGRTWAWFGGVSDNCVENNCPRDRRSQWRMEKIA